MTFRIHTKFCRDEILIIETLKTLLLQKLLFCHYFLHRFRVLYTKMTLSGEELSDFITTIIMNL